MRVRVGCVIVALALPSLAVAGPRPGVLPERITPPVQPSSTRLHIGRDHLIPARIGCPPVAGTDSCHGTVRVETQEDIGATRLTKEVSFRAPPGRRLIVRLPLSAAGRKLLGRSDLQVKLLIRDFVGPGSQTSKFVPLSLK